MTQSSRSATLRYDTAPIPDPAAAVHEGARDGRGALGTADRTVAAEPSARQWHALYARALHAPPEASRRGPPSETALRAQREFEKWCRWAASQVMIDLEHLAATRAAEFEAQTGYRVAVVCTEHPAPAPDGEPHMRFMRLALGASQVHIYSSCCPGSTPQLHLLPSRRDSLTLNQRLISKPGAYIERQPDDGYELWARGRGRARPGASDERTSVDAVLLSAFDLLVSIELDHEPLAGD